MIIGAGEKRGNDGDLDETDDRESYVDVAGRINGEDENKRRKKSNSGGNFPPIYGLKTTPQ